MRKRDRLGCWQQLLTMSGTRLLSEREWVKVYRKFLRSWKRSYHIKLDENALPAADVNPINERHHVTAPPADVVSAPDSHRYTLAPLSRTSVSPIKRRNSLAPPSAPSVCRIKRRNTLVPPSAPPIHPIECRNYIAPPSGSSVSPVNYHTSVASQSEAAPTKSLNSEGQICDTLLKTAESTNSVAPDSDIIHHTDLLLSPIKRSDSVNPEFEMIDCDEFKSPIKRRDSMAFEQWLKPIQLISPLAPSPISRRDSLSSDLVMNRKESVSPLTPTHIKRRDSSVTASPRLKSKSSQRKPQQKPLSVVKHVTGSGDELDDEMSLSTWKEYSVQRKAINTKPLGSPGNGCPTHLKVESAVKRKRGRPSREEKAKRLEEEQALKMHQALAPLNEPSMKKSIPDLTEQDLDQKSCKNEEASEHQGRAPQPLDAREKQQKTVSQPTTISLLPEPTKSREYSESPKQQPTAKPRCQSTSSVSDREGSDIAKHSNILDDDAIPPAHMPPDALDLKNPPKVPPENTEGAGKDEDEVRPKSNSATNGYSSKNGRSMYETILGSLSSDEEEDVQLLLKQTGFVLNDFQVEEQLLDDAMDLTSPVGGVEGNKDVEKQLLDNVMDLTSPVGGEDGDKDALIIDIDLDLLVRDDNVANQIALIDPQPEVSFNQCQEAINTKTPSENNDQGLETLNSNGSASANDHQLPHTSEFFEKLSSRPPVDVNADKSNMLWPFMDEDEVLDYEADHDVLTLVVSSDELEDECLSKSKEESKKTESPESRNQIITPNVQVESPKPELSAKLIDKPDIPNANVLRSFRIPRLNPELLKAQPSVMHSLYLKDDEEQNREKVKPVDPPLTEEVRQRREEAIAARRPKETTPQFAPPFRPTDSVPEDLSRPMFSPQVLVSPLFGPDDLAPIFIPPSNRQESNYPHPREALQLAPKPFVPNCSSLSNRNFPPEVPPQQHPTGVSQYMPQNLATSQRNARPVEVPHPSYQAIGAKHWMMEIFGAKCLKYLDNKCLGANCDHAMSPVGEVERRLLSMPEEILVHTYRQALRSFHIFENFFMCFVNIFERRKLYKHLLQMMANSRLYRNMTVAIIRHVFPVLKRSGLEREATGCIMTDLWMPDKAHKFSELTLEILKILEAANWQDYIDQLVELHEKYKFLLSGELMICIMKWADVTKNETLQKKAMIMLLDDMATYAQSPILMSLVDRFSNSDPNSNLPRRSPVQQQQYTASNWNHNTEPNQIPSLIQQQDRLPGAEASPSLIRKSPAIRQSPQYPAANWNHNPNTNPILAPQQERLPGAGPGPSFIRSNLVFNPQWNHNPSQNPCREPPGAVPGTSLIGSNPLPGQHQEQQQHLASGWRGQADNLNRADDKTFSNFPTGFQ